MPDVLFELPLHLRIPVAADIEPLSGIQHQAVLLQPQDVIEIYQKALMDPDEAVPFQLLFPPGQRFPDEKILLRAAQPDFMAVALQIQEILLPPPPMSVFMYPEKKRPFLPSAFPPL